MFFGPSQALGNVGVRRFCEATDFVRGTARRGGARSTVNSGCAGFDKFEVGFEFEKASGERFPQGLATKSLVDRQYERIRRFWLRQNDEPIPEGYARVVRAGS